MLKFDSSRKVVFYSALFWVATACMALALPLYAAARSLPSAEIVNKTIIANCPVSSSEKCMDTANLLQAVGSFYEIVIIVLVSLLAAVVSLVYLSIRASSKWQIEQQFEKDLESPWFQHRLQAKVDSVTQSSVAEMARRIEMLEKTLARANVHDDSEDAAADENIVANGGDDGAR